MPDKRLIAMIPARMGSRRIPLKNIRYLYDKPLIQYPIDFAKASGAFDEIWVNTESEALGRACEKMGVRFYKRPAELAGDKATNRDFVYDFLKKHPCDYVIMMNPTSPALRQETVNGFIDFVKNNDFDTVMSVIQVKAEGFCRGEMINFDGKDKIPSEQLDAIEEIMWAMTAWKRDTFIALQESGQCPVFGGKLGRYPIPKDESADLDTDEDWNIAEGVILARRQRGQTEKRYLELD